MVFNINEMITQLATQDINSITKILPHNNENVNILIVIWEKPQYKYYDYIISRSSIMDALKYKIQMKKYY